MRKILVYIYAHVYVFFSLLWIMATYPKDQIQFMYDIGMIGTAEGQRMRRLFRK